MNLHIPTCVKYAHHYDILHLKIQYDLVGLAYGLHHAVTGNALGVYPEPREQLQAFWELEEQMPYELRPLLMRELVHTASQYDRNNGNCLDEDAYRWNLAHPSAEERARAIAATYLIAMLKRLYIGGVDHPALDKLREEFKVAAVEEGADRELDFNSELWEETHFAELFGPLEGVDL